MVKVTPAGRQRRTGPKGRMGGGLNETRTGKVLRIDAVERHAPEQQRIFPGERGRGKGVHETTSEEEGGGGGGGCNAESG